MKKKTHPLSFTYPCSLFTLALPSLSSTKLKKKINKGKEKDLPKPTLLGIDLAMRIRR